MDVDIEMESCSLPEPATQLDSDVYEFVEDSNTHERRYVPNPSLGTDMFSDTSATIQQIQSGNDYPQVIEFQRQLPEALNQISENKPSIHPIQPNSVASSESIHGSSDMLLSSDQISVIVKDLVCPICLDYFHFPVTVLCGHTFCRYCINHKKLSGKACPLCRQPMGKSFSINIILTSMLKSLGLRRKLLSLPKDLDYSSTDDQSWWEENCLKPQISVVLFLRIYFGDFQESSVFFDDLVNCVIDFFNKQNLWERSRYMFTLADLLTLRRAIGYDKNDNDATLRLQNWVEDYLVSNPQLCPRIDTPPFLMKVFQDTNHKIEGRIFFSGDIQNKLPWDVGRHTKSLLNISHSSVSLSHLLMVPTPNYENSLFGIIDCGSTIGTMIRLNKAHPLSNGDRIHLGDKHEAEVSFSVGCAGSTYKGSMWNPTKQCVMDHIEATHADTTLEPIESNLLLKIFSDGQEAKEEWIDPKGVVIGRGPLTQSVYKKLSITYQNGYISREHCLIFYDGNKDPGSRWILRDLSTLGTYIKVPPFSNPVPIYSDCVFKVGQCKIEAVLGTTSSIFTMDRANERLERADRLEDDRIDYHMRNGEQRMAGPYHHVGQSTLYPPIRQGPYDFLSPMGQDRLQHQENSRQILSFPFHMNYQRVIANHGNNFNNIQPRADTSSLDHSNEGSMNPEPTNNPSFMSVSNAYNFLGSNGEEPDQPSFIHSGMQSLPYSMSIPVLPPGSRQGMTPNSNPGSFHGDMQAMVNHAFAVAWDSYIRSAANANNDENLAASVSPNAPSHQSVSGNEIGPLSEDL